MKVLKNIALGASVAMVVAVIVTYFVAPIEEFILLAFYGFGVVGVYIIIQSISDDIDNGEYPEYLEYDESEDLNDNNKE